MGWTGAQRCFGPIIVKQKKMVLIHRRLHSYLLFNYSFYFIWYHLCAPSPFGLKCFGFNDGSLAKSNIHHRFYFFNQFKIFSCFTKKVQSIYMYCYNSSLSGSLPGFSIFLMLTCQILKLFIFMETMFPIVIFLIYNHIYNIYSCVRISTQTYLLTFHFYFKGLLDLYFLNLRVQQDVL